MDLWVCCAAVKPKTGGGGGLDSWVVDLWVCCVAVKPKTSGGGGSEGSVWGGGLVWICGLWIYGCVVLL